MIHTFFYVSILSHISQSKKGLVSYIFWHLSEVNLREQNNDPPANGLALSGSLVGIHIPDIYYSTLCGVHTPYSVRRTIMDTARAPDHRLSSRTVWNALAATLSTTCAT
ncbi:hypothetical protein ACN38_g6359 [Penicillium nordicum]|uniref:Uncharacterized protein n=1 Tax=Penicillium nordicum TaxID=229535 RepID=A0A0M9WFD4_9EURO|nr:hypothetical protein ACN38_g6359 [Penicillium nordicum]